MNGSRKLGWAYCQEALPRVSRTFALNIRVLRGELHRCVLLGYLVCRILDTVEDSASLSPEARARLLRRFPSVVSSGAWERLLREWVRDAKAEKLDGNSADVELVERSVQVISCFKRLNPEYQRLSERMFATMAHGMAEYSERSLPGGEWILRDLEDLERYCYYVAGVVGEFLCGSFLLAYSIEGRTAQTLREHCVAFGLGLQITNIAKDILRDRRGGRTYVPESFLREARLSAEEFRGGERPLQALSAYRALLSEAYANLRRGYTFTRTIPRRHFRLRLFCIRPLWMAFETVKTLAAHPDLLADDRDVKISRKQVRRILLATTPMVAGNWMIERSFSRKYSPPAVFPAV